MLRGTPLARPRLCARCHARRPVAMTRWWAGPLVVVLLAAGLWLTVLRDSFPGYDSMWALVWGQQAAGGHVPDLDALAGAPTPHPLAIATAAVLSPLGPSIGG